MGIGGRIRFIGHVPHDKLPGFLKKADIFIRPSLSEGLGTSFLEAMAMGLPVIGTRVGGITDFLKDNETGFFCEVRNPSSIARVVREILSRDNIAKVAQITQNARELIQTKYTWSKISEEIEGILDRLIKNEKHLSVR